MIPKTEIRYSFIYNKRLNENISSGDFRDIKKRFEKFVRLYSQNINNILELIEKNCNPWSREYIPIYLVDAKIKSFSDPLTLVIKDDEKFMFLLLIHELIHNNLTKKYKNPSDSHKVVEVVFDKVIEELSLDDFEEALERYEKIR